MHTNLGFYSVYGSKKLLFRVIFAALSVLIMVAIFCFSAQNGAVSSKTSGRVVTFVIKTFYTRFAELSATEKAELIKTFQFVFRKTAHFSIYFLLGFNVFGFFSTLKLSRVKMFAFSVSICVFYAISDEFHQLYSAGRSGNFRDILIDSTGVLCAVVLLFAFLNLLYKKGKVMRKKIVIEQNALLTEKLVEANKEINRLNNLLAEANDKILMLIKTSADQEPIAQSQVEEKFEYEDFSDLKLEENNNEIIEDYAAGVIAKIVLETSKAEIVFSSNNINSDKRNLVLGFAESAKAEVFKIISENEDFNTKKLKIDDELLKTQSYIKEMLG